MTVKDLKMMLQFYPENAEIFVQSNSGRLSEPEHFNEALIEHNPTAIVLTLKESAAKLQAV